MAGDLSISGNKLKTGEIYNNTTLRLSNNSQVTSNNNGVTTKSSEDELVNYQGDSNSSEAKLTKLMNEYDKLLAKLFRLYSKIEKETQKQQSFERQLIRMNENSERQNEIQSKINESKNKISSFNSTIDGILNKMSSLTVSMSEIDFDYSSSNALTTSGIDSTGNIDSTGGVDAFGNTTGSTSAGSSVTGTTQIDSKLAQRLDAKLGQGFAAKCESVANAVGCNPNDLLAMMYSESGINPKAGNPNGGATGLIQFMPSTLSGNGYSVSQVKNMSAVQQLDVVKDILLKSKAMCGYGQNEKIDAGTLYAINFLPATAKNEVLCSSGGKLGWAYSANSPLDLDKDGSITKSDLSKRLNKKYQEMVAYF